MIDVKVSVGFLIGLIVGVAYCKWCESRKMG